MKYEYKIEDIRLAEGYTEMIMNHVEFEKIIKEQFKSKIPAIIYNHKGKRFLLDTKARILLLEK